MIGYPERRKKEKKKRLEKLETGKVEEWTS